MTIKLAVNILIIWLVELDDLFIGFFNVPSTCIRFNLYLFDFHCRLSRVFSSQNLGIS